MKKLMKKRAGFTLVELLIVIIIIGILAGAMLLVAGSGTDKAEATKIISNLRSLKAAALMYYADHPSTTALSGDQIAVLKSYMDRDITTPNAAAKYVFVSASTTSPDIWAVGLDGATAYPGSGVRDKLEAVAGEVGLYPSATVTGTNYNKEDDVYMRAR